MLNAKVDANQAEIVKALRKIGASVRSLHRVGDGVPDVLVGYRGQNYLLEVKDGSLSPSQRKLTPLQVDFHNTWAGEAVVVLSVDEALDYLQSRQSK